MKVEFDSLDSVTAQPVDLPDIQARDDAPDIAIRSAGICGLRLPMQITDIDGYRWQSVVQAEAGVSVPGRTRGAHMSRFVEFLEQQHRHGLDLAEIGRLTDRLLPLLGAPSGSLSMRFPCFVTKQAPVSGKTGSLDIDAGYHVAANTHGTPLPRQWLTVPVMTLCPCSKAISDYGAHNQRTLVTLAVDDTKVHAIRKLTALIESCASSPVYPVLKRADEKYVTEYSYENPMFVEDVARAVYIQALTELAGAQISVRVESQESIHNHQAYAVVDAATCVGTPAWIREASDEQRMA
ncbi:GTP cyclohydrolase I FolE2 [Spectribacter hydrogenooxidans]|uniref:GTP cyclohydrolase, FolE2/MptA family n=1 Tax=Spectribacter hydrogenoxidans TaxID=3075608 RepID=A0ABU3C2C3_9GAMM|nr:GTP cyclohydrolase, FolE2/MptA family [Salinisphaera sp. W335]MDT0635697.1 GTP cyclohydrolase, FolE2/MptA family [Salinisphaera sp. W335]